MLVRTNKASFVLHFLCTWDRTQQTLSSFAWVLTDTTSMLHTMSILRWFGSHCTPGQHTKLGLCGVLLAASKLHNMIPGYSWVEMDYLHFNYQEMESTLVPCLPIPQHDRRSNSTMDISLGVLSDSIMLHHATWHILDMKSLACMHTSLHKQSPGEHGNHHLRGVVGFGFRANLPQSDAALAVDSIHIQTNLPNQVHYYTTLV